MDLRTLGFAVTMFAGLAGAHAQTISPGLAEVNRSSERAIVFSGSVMLEGGSAPSAPVLIQRVCNGRTHFAAWTGAKGSFSFKMETGGSDTATADAAQPASQAADMNKPYGASTVYSNPITSALRDCELEAVLPGFRSERVRLAVKNMLDDARVGTIILYPLSRAGALTVSATTLQAPSNARKAYEKGLEALRAQKWDAAAGEFTKAVNIYPNFAVAWYELGRLRQNRNDAAGAAEAWKAALHSDPKYVRPYESLTTLADRKQDWVESRKYSSEWIQLDPESFPEAYLFNAIANARLNEVEQAERAAREGLRLDKDRRIPRMHYVLGLILLQKREYGESAKCLRTYLELAPNAADAAIVRRELSRIETAPSSSP